MTIDQELDSALRRLLREPAITRTDGLHRALATVETTPQHSHRWWPFPDRSGHAPARGFTMFSAVKFVAAAAIVALFGGFLLAGAMTTQQGEEAVPAAVTASPSPASTYVAPQPVSGKMTAGPKFQTNKISRQEDRQTYRGAALADTIVMDDARLSGTMYRVRNLDAIGEKFQHHDGEVWTGTLELVSDGGSWIGTMRGYTSMNPATLHWHMELTGTGTHEGLSALLSAEGPYGSWDVEGFVFPGVLPEYPLPVEIPAE